MWLSYLFAQIKKQAGTSRLAQRRRASRRVGLEVLEDRRLLTISTATALVASPSPLYYGQAETLSATVSAPSSTSAVTFGGTVDFKDTVAGKVKDLGATTVNSTSGLATLIVSTLGPGANNIVAYYSGAAATTTPVQDSLGNSSSKSAAVQVNQTDTTLGLTVAPATGALAGQTETAIAALTVVEAGTGTPGGKIAFTVDGRLVSTVSIATATTTGVTLPALSTATHTIDATYLGDGNYKSSTAPGVNVTVGEATTSVTVTSTAPTTGSEPFGEPIVFTATVNVTAPGGGHPGGTVQFWNGDPSLSTSSVIGAASVNRNGQATAAVSSLALGSYSIFAKYLGNSSYQGNTSAALPVSIGQASTTTTVTGRPNPIPVGESLTFTASVVGNYGTSSGGLLAAAQPLFGFLFPGTAPTGSVTFTIDGNASTAVTVPLGGHARASYTTSFSAVGLHTITAVYSGDTDYAASPVSQTFTEYVGMTATSTRVSATPKYGPLGQVFSFTVTVNGQGGTPSGTVTLLDADNPTGAPLGTGTLNAGATSISVTFATPGFHSVIAEYSGDNTFAGSQGYGIVLVTNKTAPSTTTNGLAPPVAWDLHDVVAQGFRPAAAGSQAVQNVFAGW